MTSTHDHPPGADAPAAGAGWYPHGRPGELAEWDGEAWTGARRDADDVAAPPRWRHRPAAFLGHRWFHLMALGTVLTVVPGWAVAATGVDHWAWAALPGAALFLVAVLPLVEPHLQLRSLDDRRLLLAAGVAAGLVAVGLALVVEGRGEHGLGLTLREELWLAGPVEETLKLLVPVALLAVGGRRFRSPRAGVLMVLAGGATFGAVEAVLYIGRAERWGPLAQAVARPASELLHPFLTAAAAAVIWLAARRAGRVLTPAGLVAWVAAMAVHSLHDGVPTLGSAPTTVVADVATPASAVAQGVGLLVVGVAFSSLVYLMFRHAARELVPPYAVATSAPHWRPALRRWGCPPRRGVNPG